VRSKFIIKRKQCARFFHVYDCIVGRRIDGGEDAVEDYPVAVQDDEDEKQTLKLFTIHLSRLAREVVAK